jgi:hypothetical protein
MFKIYYIKNGKKFEAGINFNPGHTLRIPLKPKLTASSVFDAGDFPNETPQLTYEEYFFFKEDGTDLIYSANQYPTNKLDIHEQSKLRELLKEAYNDLCSQKRIELPIIENYHLIIENFIKITKYNKNFFEYLIEITNPSNDLFYQSKGLTNLVNDISYVLEELSYTSQETIEKIADNFISVFHDSNNCDTFSPLHKTYSLIIKLIKKDSSKFSKYVEYFNNINESSVAHIAESLVMFYKIDDNWVFNKFQEIYNTDKWLTFFDWYLLCQPLYNDFWKPLKKYYIKSFRMFDKLKYGESCLIIHICLAHIRLKISDSELYNLLIRDHINNHFVMEHVIKFYANKVSYELENLKKTDFLQYDFFIKEHFAFFTLLLGNLTILNKSIKSNIIYLFNIYTEINEDFVTNFKKIAKYLPEQYNVVPTLELISNLKNKGTSYKYIPDLFLEMLQYYTPDTFQGYVETILKYCYEKKENIDKLNEIVNIYSSRGYSSLDDLVKRG